MKTTTLQLRDFINNKEIEAHLKNLSQIHPNHYEFEMSIEDAIELFSFICKTISTEINTNRFDKLSQTRRVTFLNFFKAIDENHRNVNSVMKQIDGLNDLFQTSGFLLNRIGKTDFKTEHIELYKLKKKYKSITDELDKSRVTLSFIEKSKEELNEFITKAENHANQIASLNDKVDSEHNHIIDKYLTFQNQLNDQLQNYQNRLVEVKQVQDDIEEKRLSIFAFSKNIDEYKESIKQLEDNLNMLLNKDNEVKTLIKDAKEALKLGSAVGISSAFSSQYSDSINIHKRAWWIAGAIIFLLGAIGLTIWIVADTKNVNNWASIIGRIAAITISISGAAFCSKQYVKQKQITEDYAYKAVLSKSIVAFTDEIGVSSENGDQHVGDYLNKVLSEIHKDPLRERKRESNSTILSEKQIEQLTKLVQSLKLNG